MPESYNSLYPAVSPRQITDYSQSELADLFAALPCPDLEEMSGNYRGKFYGLFTFEKLPRSLRFYLVKLMQLPILGWAGKSFNDGEGANLLFSVAANIKAGFYEVSERRSFIDGKDTVFLSYDLEKNPAIFRGVRGEVRSLDNGIYLCRMLMIGRDKIRTVLYFTLEK